MLVNPNTGAQLRYIHAHRSLAPLLNSNPFAKQTVLQHRTAVPTATATSQQLEPKHGQLAI